MEQICPKVGKTSYSTQSEASQARAGFRRRTKEKRIEVYRCTFCNGWHIGHRAVWKGGRK